MAKQIKIKDIARMAGVSAGTVDRVLHKRGNVSKESQEAIERVLAEVGYKYNIHASAISYRKTLRLAIVIPEAPEGEYWGAIRAGLEHAIEEFDDIETECVFLFYDQFDVNSCCKAFKQVIDSNPDAVVIGPTYIDETIHLCGVLDEQNIPYIFIDSKIEGTTPLSTFSCDQTSCGALAARLMLMTIPEGGDVAIFSAERSGNRISHNSFERRKGFRTFFKHNASSIVLKEVNYSICNQADNERKMAKFLSDNPHTKGIAVLNSRGFIIADLLQKCGRNDIKIVSFDLTARNAECLDKGQITVLLCQRPEQQGFNAIKTLLNHLLFKNIESGTEYVMPIDILFKENLKYYTEITNL